MDDQVFRYGDHYVLLLAIGPRYAVVQRLDADSSASQDRPDQRRNNTEWLFPITPQPAVPEDYRLEPLDQRPFATRGDMAAWLHEEAIKDAGYEAYLSRESAEPLLLTDEQLAYMLSHHSEIERATFHPDLYDFVTPETGNAQLIGDVISEPLFRQTFGSMSWDDAYDRYEDAPLYDGFFKAVLGYTFALAQGLQGWALDVHRRSYPPALLQALLEFEAAEPETFKGLVSSANRMKASLHGAPDYDSDLDAFYRDAADTIRRFRMPPTPKT